MRPVVFRVAPTVAFLPNSRSLTKTGTPRRSIAGVPDGGRRDPGSLRNPNHQRNPKLRKKRKAGKWKKKWKEFRLVFQCRGDVYLHVFLPVKNRGPALNYFFLHPSFPPHPFTSKEKSRRARYLEMTRLLLQRELSARLLLLILRQLLSPTEQLLLKIPQQLFPVPPGSSETHYLWQLWPSLKRRGETS